MMSEPKKFNPNIGDIVAVCYDGKMGRMVKGKVLARKGFMIHVAFKEWASDNKKEINWWFPRHNKWSYGGFVKCDDSLMQKLFGASGDWYSVYELPKDAIINKNLATKKLCALMR